MKKLVLLFLLLALFCSPGWAVTKTFINGGVNNNWSTAGNWSPANKPASGDDVVLNASSPDCVVNESTAYLNSFDMNGYTNTFSGTGILNVTPATGTVICRFAGTITWNNTLQLDGSGFGPVTINLYTGGKTLTRIFVFRVYQSSSSVTVSQQDDLTMTDRLWAAGGTWTTNNHNITTPSFFSHTSENVVNLGSSTVTITGYDYLGVTQWHTLAGTTTLNAGTSTIVMADQTNDMYFDGGGLTYYHVSVVGGGASRVLFNQSNTFAKLPQVTGGSKTLVFTNGTTQTFTDASDGFGNGSNVVTILYDSSGSAALFTTS